MTTRIFVPEGTVERIVIAAPGPSLTREQCRFTLQPDIMNIVIGNAWDYNPYADILYHCDRKWWAYHKGVPEFQGCSKVSLEDSPHTYNLKESTKREGLDLSPSTIVTGRNSGYQAINLAAHYRPKQIILIGYDMKDTDGKHNIHGDHPPEIKMPCNFKMFRTKLATLVKPLEDLGIKVYNCTIDTALECFERRELEDVL